MAVARVMIFVMGFECDSIIPLNNSREGNASCLKDGEEKSAMTAKASTPH